MILAAVADQRAACAPDQYAFSPSFRSNDFCDRAFGFSRLLPPESPPYRGSGISRLRQYHASPSVCEPVHISRRNDRVPDVLSPGKVGGTISEMRLGIQKVREEAPAHDLSPNAVPAPRYPIVGSFVACCARAESGHAVAPPSSVMKPRRLNPRKSNLPDIQEIVWLVRGRCLQ